MSAGAHRDHRHGGVRVGHHQGLLRPPARPPADEAGGERRYRLRPSIEVVRARGDVYLLRPGEDGDLAIREPDAADLGLIERLAEAPATLEELAEALRLPAGTVRDKLDALAAADALAVQDGVPGTLGEIDLERFARQLPYLAERGDPARLQRRVRDARVVLLGCGGLGTWTIAALAALGIGSVVLIDDDEVALSNLNRQILFTAADVGSGKAERAAAWVRAFDPAIDAHPVTTRIGAPGDLTPLLEGASALVHAADTPPYELERWVNTACLAAGVPWIASGQMPPTLKVGPLYIPGRTACFACHERHLARRHALWDDVVRSRSESRREATTLGPASGLAGTMIALQLLDLVTGTEPPATAGRAVLVDMRTLATRTEEVPRDADCPACRAHG